MDTQELNRTAREFALMADGEFALKYRYQQSHNSVSILFYAGGYVEFTPDKILAVMDGERSLVWEIFPNPVDYRAALARFSDLLKG